MDDLLHAHLAQPLGAGVLGENVGRPRVPAGDRLPQEIGDVRNSLFKIESASPLAFLIKMPRPSLLLLMPTQMRRNKIAQLANSALAAVPS